MENEGIYVTSGKYMDETTCLDEGSYAVPVKGTGAPFIVAWTRAMCPTTSRRLSGPALARSCSGARSAGLILWLKRPPAAACHRFATACHKVLDR